MKTLKYIFIVAALTSSVTAYGSTKISIGFSFQSAPQPVYIYRPVPVYQQQVVYYTSPQPVYTCAQPVYVNRTSVYRQPAWSLSFSWGNGGRSFNDDNHSYNDSHRSFNDGRNNNRGGNNFHNDGRDRGRAHR